MNYSAKSTEENIQVSKDLENNRVAIESNNAISNDLLQDKNKIKKKI